MLMQPAGRALEEQRRPTGLQDERQSGGDGWQHKEEAPSLAGSAWGRLDGSRRGLLLPEGSGHNDERPDCARSLLSARKTLAT